MAVNSGNPVSNALYNSVQTSLNNVMGPNGYNQTLTSAQLSKGRPVQASDWNNLRTDINKCRQHQTGSAFTNAELPAVIAGQPIRSDLNVYETQMGTVAANMYKAALANMTLTSSATTVTRGSSWGTSGTPSITCEVQAAWASNAAMNQFFSTGGEIRWALAHPTTGTAQNNSWNTFLSGLGTSDVHAGTTTTTSNNVKFAFGSLTTTYQRIYLGTNTATSYTANTVTINAKLNATSTGVVIQIILNDAHTNAYSDTVASGTNVTFSVLRSTVVMTGVSNPTFTTLTAF